MSNFRFPLSRNPSRDLFRAARSLLSQRFYHFPIIRLQSASHKSPILKYRFWNRNETSRVPFIRAVKWSIGGVLPLGRTGRYSTYRWGCAIYKMYRDVMFFKNRNEYDIASQFSIVHMILNRAQFFIANAIFLCYF